MDHAPPDGADTASDPVCGMTVRIAGARNKADHGGHTYYFCSPRCRAKFTAEPLRYLKPAEGAAKIPLIADLVLDDVARVGARA